MGKVWQKCIEKTAIQAAFVAIASRIVGSAFRCLETLNPQFKQSNVGSDPKTVFIREMSTIGMAWGFALVTSAMITERLKARQWSSAKIQFLTSVIGTLIAESVGRLIAYRKIYQHNSGQICNPKAPITGLNTLHEPVIPLASPMPQSGWASVPQTVPYRGFPAISPFL